MKTAADLSLETDHRPSNQSKPPPNWVNDGDPTTRSHVASACEIHVVCVQAGHYSRGKLPAAGSQGAICSVYEKSARGSTLGKRAFVIPCNPTFWFMDVDALNCISKPSEKTRARRALPATKMYNEIQPSCYFPSKGPAIVVARLFQTALATIRERENSFVSINNITSNIPSVIPIPLPTSIVSAQISRRRLRYNRPRPPKRVYAR